MPANLRPLQAAAAWQAARDAAAGGQPVQQAWAQSVHRMQLIAGRQHEVQCTCTLAARAQAQCRLHGLQPCSTCCFLGRAGITQKRHAFSGSGSPSQNPKRVLLTGCVNKLKPFQKKEPSVRFLFSGNSELAVRPNSRRLKAEREGRGPPPPHLHREALF